MGKAGQGRDQAHSSSVFGPFFQRSGYAASRLGSLRRQHNYVPCLGRIDHWHSNTRCPCQSFHKPCRSATSHHISPLRYDTSGKLILADLLATRGSLISGLSPLYVTATRKELADIQQQKMRVAGECGEHDRSTAGLR